VASGSPRNRRLLAVYGISVTQWNRMYTRQNGVCPICLRPIFKPGNKFGKATAHVDHDHKSKRVRGLLCWRCNKHRIGNSTCEHAKRMVDYLCSDFDGRKL
jgi:hypothetical protein